MKVWQIWGNHQKHFRYALEDFLKECSFNEEILLLCPEECDIGLDFNYTLLKKYKNLKIVFGGFDSNFKIYKNKKTVLWPNYFMYHAVYTRDSDIIETSPNNLKYLFTCMNRFPKIHRSLLMDKLSKYNLLDVGTYSWHEKSNFKYKFWKETINTLDGKFIGQQNKFPPQMYESCIDLITESVIDTPFITEKTYNAILFKKPFIIFGYPNTHKYLESIGYKMPHEVIDYEFDSELNHNKRAEKISKELLRLSTYNYKDLYYKLQDSVEHNYEVLKRQVNSQFGIPDIVKSNNYYYNRIEESVRKCKLDL